MTLFGAKARDRLRAEAEVLKAGLTLVVVGARVEGIGRKKALVCGEMLGTFIVLRDTSDAEQRVHS
ncbi:MAG TPA: hypothetical protein VGQ34_08370 [Sphingomicrobium sp.]|jgi:acyl-coenzyme A thioesterase PaaI-like protein|nr:hypothetical protein [Sphingomicrobium sp.]